MSKHRGAMRFRYSALALALGLGLATSVVSAQSTTGSIYGNVGTGGGDVVLENLDTGARLTLRPDASGRYTANALPTGRYRVTLQRDGAILSQRDGVQVLVGRGTEVGFVAGAGGTEATNMAAVTVTGQLHQIDVSQIESRTVITKDELDRLPIARNLGQISLLAPGVVSGDSRYSSNGAALPSFAGSSQSENAYYINGFSVINPLTNIGYTQLPFNAISQVQISTGGYGVEYGRATGGVVNVITARGTNDFEAGGQVIWRPESLMAAPRNIYYGPNERNLGAFGDAGRIYQYRNQNTFGRKTYSAYVGGPIIPDRLFFYAAGEFVDQEGQGTRIVANSNATVNGTALQTGWNENQTDIPRWLGKIDWQINDDHRVELTGFMDRNKVEDAYFGFDYRNEAYTHDFVQRGGLFTDDKNTTYVANYTGYFTDDLTITAMYGEAKYEHISLPFNYDASCPRTSVTSAPPGLTIPNCQNATAALLIPDANDKTTGYRFDIEYRLGSHTLRAGYDYQDVKSLTGTSLPGGATFNYLRATNPNEAILPSAGIGSPASGGGFGTQGYYVQRLVNGGRSSIEVEQKAQYIKDLWQVTDNVLVEIGVRNEQFANFNSAGQAFAEKNRQIAPRFGATWDVNGDASLKLFAYAGRYHLAMPPNVAYRGADGIVNTQEFFTYTGVDPVTGVPTGANSLGPVYSANNEFGLPKDPRTVAADDLRSHYQDSFALGMEQRLGVYNVGAKLSYSTLRSAIDDFCDYRPFEAWGARNGYSEDDAEYFANTFSCALFNPGESNAFYQDYDGDGTLEYISLSSADLGYPKLKRKYYALDLFAERPFDGVWYGKLDYTFSRNYGNAEGQLLSDLGQADVSQTQNFDFPELMRDASGLLPNHRKHQIKALGMYQFAPEWIVSMRGIYASGRPRNCLGGYDYPDRATNPSVGYGSSFFICDGRPVPRGTFGNLPAVYSLDLGLRYAPKAVEGLQFAVDVYNVANRQSATGIWERRNQGTSVTTVSPDWGRVINYTAPRSIEFTLRYDWGRGRSRSDTNDTPMGNARPNS